MVKPGNAGVSTLLRAMFASFPTTFHTFFGHRSQLITLLICQVSKDI
jgi:hypothetical protein